MHISTLLGYIFYIHKNLSPQVNGLNEQNTTVAVHIYFFLNVFDSHLLMHKSHTVSCNFLDLLRIFYI